MHPLLVSILNLLLASLLSVQSAKTVFPRSAFDLNSLKLVAAPRGVSKSFIVLREGPLLVSPLCDRLILDTSELFVFIKLRVLLEKVLVTDVLLISVTVARMVLDTHVILLKICFAVV